MSFLKTGLTEIKQSHKYVHKLELFIESKCRIEHFECRVINEKLPNV